MFLHLLDSRGFAETGNVAVGPFAVLLFAPPLRFWLAAPLAEGVDDPADVGVVVGVAHAIGEECFAVAAAGKDAECARLHRAELAGVDEERLALAIAPAVLEVLAGLVAVEEPEADGDAGGVEELGGQRDDAVHQIGFNDALAYFTFAAGIAGKRSVGHDEAGDAATAPIGRGQVMDEVLNPRVVGVAGRRRAVAPADIVLQKLAGPVADVERWIGEDVVGFEVGMQVAEERVGWLRAEVGLDGADREVHVRKAPRRGVGLLAEDGDVGGVAAVGFDEAVGLDEHAAGAAARVVHAALVGFEHLNQQSNDAARRVELAAEFAFGLSELAEEVFVYATECVAGFGAVAFEAYVGNEVDEALELDRFDAASSVVAWKLALEVRVVALDGEDGVIDECGDVRAGCLVLEVRPARFRRHPEDTLGGVLVPVLEETLKLLTGDVVGFEFGLQFFTAGFEGVGDVLQEEQAEDDVLVLGGIDLSTQGVGGLPQRVGVDEVGVGVGVIRHVRVAPVSLGVLSQPRFHGLAVEPPALAHLVGRCRLRSAPCGPSVPTRAVAPRQAPGYAIVRVREVAYRAGPPVLAQARRSGVSVVGEEGGGFLGVVAAAVVELGYHLRQWISAKM